MKRNFFLFLSIAFFSIFSIFPASSFSQVLISEVLPDPARDWDGDGSVSYRGDEWVEIVNTGSQPVSIDSFLLADGGGTLTVRYRFSGFISSKEVMVVFGSDAIAWQSENGVQAYGLSLNNSGDAVYLLRVANGDTVVVDSLKYSGADADDDRAIGRDAETPSLWLLFDAYNPCSSGCSFESSGFIPTPGSANNCITPVENSTWGAIKALYGD